MVNVPDPPEFAERACQKTIWGPRVTSWKCYRRGVARERELVGGKPRGAAKWWCKQHLPSSEKKRDDARMARYRAERESDDRMWARRGAERELMAWARRCREQLPSAMQAIVDKYEENADPGDES